MQYEFTEEEKELIVNTPITEGCFDIEDRYAIPITTLCQFVETSVDFWLEIVTVCETLRQKYNETKDEQCFIELVRMLPNSYKAVNLHKERKDRCLKKHYLSANSRERESASVPCYEAKSCDYCHLYEEKPKI